MMKIQYYPDMQFRTLKILGRVLGKGRTFSAEASCDHIRKAVMQTDSTQVAVGGVNHCSHLSIS